MTREPGFLLALTEVPVRVDEAGADGAVGGAVEIGVALWTPTRARLSWDSPARDALATLLV